MEQALKGKKRWSIKNRPPFSLFKSQENYSLILSNQSEILSTASSRSTSEAFAS